MKVTDIIYGITYGITGRKRRKVKSVLPLNAVVDTPLIGEYSAASNTQGPPNVSHAPNKPDGPRPVGRPKGSGKKNVSDENGDNDEIAEMFWLPESKFKDTMKTSPFDRKVPKDKLEIKEAAKVLNQRQALGHLQDALVQLEIDVLVTDVTGEYVEHTFKIDYNGFPVSRLKSNLAALSLEYAPHQLQLTKQNDIRAYVGIDTDVRYSTNFKLTDSPYNFYIIDSLGIRRNFSIGGCHTLIAGMTRSGKTVTSIGVLYNMLYHFKRKKYGKVMILNADKDDAHEATLEIFRSHKRLYAFTLSAEKDATIQCLLLAQSVMNNRLKSGRNTDDRRSKYSAVAGKEWEPLYVYVDEADDLASANELAMEIIFNIVAKGGKYNVWIVLMTQTARAEVLGGKVLSNFATILCHKLRLSSHSQLVLDDDTATNLKGNGHCVLVNADGRHYGQVPLVDIKDAKRDADPLS